MKRKSQAACHRCGKERVYSGDSPKCLKCGSKWPLTQAERDERIVSEADANGLLSYVQGDPTGFLAHVAIHTRHLTHEQCAEVGEAVCRIINRIVRARRKK